MSKQPTACVGIIGGTGLGQALASHVSLTDAAQHTVDTPFGPPSSPILTGLFAGTPIAILNRHGDGHIHNPSHVPYRANIYAMKKIGCTHILATGAVGSLREEIRPGDIALCDQFIDRTIGRPRSFYEHAAVHVEFADPTCPVMRQWLIDAGNSATIAQCHRRATYICIEGPGFSTRAESHMHRQWGADVVGMTALPEARLAREAELAYALIALPTDYDCWRSEGQPPATARAAETAGNGDTIDQADPSAGSADAASLIAEIKANLNQAAMASIELIKTALSDTNILRSTPSPAHDALQLAIWSEKSNIDPSEITRLETLWGRYFSSDVR